MTAATKTPPSVGRNVFVPKDGFTANIDGGDVTFTKYTYVREGHWILDKYPELFEPVRVQYDVEQATAGPGERRA
jgi:hypothetical protein